MNDIIEHDENRGAVSNAQAPSMVAHLVRAEIEQQIATARQFPRQITKVARQITSLATMSESAAAKCTYALPRGGKPITGPSIGMARIIKSQWGNCRTGARVIHVDRQEGFVEAEGVFHDLETNTATVKRVRRNIKDRHGKVFNDDMITVTGNAACSIAERNAILDGVPEAVWGDAYDDALRTVRGDMDTLTERRAKSVSFMANYGWTPEQVYAVLGVTGEKDVNLDQLLTLRGMVEAIKSGETTAEELLNTIEAPAVSNRPAAGQIGTSRRTTTRREEPKSEVKPDDGAAQRKAKEDADAKAKAEQDAAKKEEAGRIAIEEAERRQRESEKKAKSDESERAAQQRELEEAEARHHKERAERDAQLTQKDDAPVADHDDETGEVYDEEYCNTMFDKILDEMGTARDPKAVVDGYAKEIEILRVNAPDLHADLQNEIENI